MGLISLPPLPPLPPSSVLFLPRRICIIALESALVVSSSLLSSQISEQYTLASFKVVPAAMKVNGIALTALLSVVSALELDVTDQGVPLLDPLICNLHTCTISNTSKHPSRLPPPELSSTSSKNIRSKTTSSASLATPTGGGRLDSIGPSSPTTSTSLTIRLLFPRPTS